MHVLVDCVKILPSISDIIKLNLVKRVCIVSHQVLRTWKFDDVLGLVVHLLENTGLK